MGHESEPKWVDPEVETARYETKLRGQRRHMRELLGALAGLAVLGIVGAGTILVLSPEQSLAAIDPLRAGRHETADLVRAHLLPAATSTPPLDVLAPPLPEWPQARRPSSMAGATSVPAAKPAPPSRAAARAPSPARRSAPPARVSPGVKPSESPYREAPRPATEPYAEVTPSPPPRAPRSFDPTEI